MKKRWVFGALLAMVVAIGAIGGTVMAQDSEEGDNDSGSEHSGADEDVKASRVDVLARVAVKLGVDETELRTAFEEAQDEVRAELIEARIDQLVDSGRITADEGEELKTWYSERPAAADHGRSGRRGFDHGPRHGFSDGSGRGFRSGGRGGDGHKDGDDAPESALAPQGDSTGA